MGNPWPYHASQNESIWYKNLLWPQSTTASEQDQNSVCMCACYKMHPLCSDVIAAWSTPPLHATHTPINTSCALLSPRQHRPAVSPAALSWRSMRVWGVYEGREVGGGRVDSWADTEAPHGFAGAGLFPSHPAAVQLPRHQLSWWSHQTDQGLPHCGGWLRNEWRWRGMVSLYGPADTL